MERHLATRDDITAVLFNLNYHLKDHLHLAIEKAISSCVMKAMEQGDRGAAETELFSNS